MTRGHRAAHRLIWPLLALVVAALFVHAIVTRPPPEPPQAAIGSPQAATEPPQDSREPGK